MRSLLAAIRPGLLLSILAAAIPGLARAQEPTLNYDSLSFLKEPLATEIGDVTVLFNGLADLQLGYDSDTPTGEDEIVFNPVGLFQVSAFTQLPNRWRVGVSYLGNYERRPYGVFVDGFSTDEDVYTDNVAGFVSGVWGQLAGGDVSGMVREATRRQRGVGLAALAFDDALGGLDSMGGSYIGRYSQVLVGGAVDEDGNFDLGLTFKRPIGKRDYRVSARYTHSEFVAANGLDAYDTNHVQAVGEITFGSTVFDLGVGYEHFDGAPEDADRYYASAGVRHKAGALTLSLEGHIGALDGDGMYAASAGARFDLARGLSANLGINYEKADVRVGGARFLDADSTVVAVSLRYAI